MNSIDTSMALTGAGALVVALVGYLLFRKWRAGGAASGSPEPPPRRPLLTPRTWRVLAIFTGGIALLLFAHLYVKDKDNVGFLLTHEVGFALIVSLVVWALFEAQLSHEAEAAWDQRIERVTKNVFQAVLRKDLPKPLLNEANNLVLNSSLVRSAFTVIYTLRDSEFELEAGGRAECVLVDALMEFTMQNVSTDDVCWKAGLQLPNPVHPGMKRLVTVHSLKVTKGGEDVAMDLPGALEEFQRQLQDDARTAVPYVPGEVMLRPGEACDFSASYVMAKEAEDTELLQTLYPADGLRVTIFDAACDTRRAIFARSVHRQSVENVGEQGTGTAKIFRLTGYLLPHQGVLIWWKRKTGVQPR